MPINFSKLKPKLIITKKVLITLSIQLNDCSLSIEEIEDRINILIKHDRSQNLAGVTVDLLRTAQASTWEEAGLEVKEIK